MNLVLWIIIAISFAGAIGSGAWTLARRDRTPDAALGPNPFSDEVYFRVRVPTRLEPVISLRAQGRLRLLIGEDLIATRAIDIPRWWGTLGWRDFTFRAASCSVRRSGEGERLALAGVSGLARRLGGPRLRDGYVALSGPRGHRTVEMQIGGPKTASLDDIWHQLIRAGARPVER